MTSTVGKILLKNYLPEDLHPYIDETLLDKKGISDLFSKLAEKHPDTYKDATTNLTRLGFEVATREGSSVSLDDLISPIDKDKFFDEAQVKVDKINAGNKSKEDKESAIAKTYFDLSDDLNKELLSEGLKKNHTLAKVILSGSRGSPAQYRQTVASPVMVVDEKNKPMTNMIIRNSFAEGLSLPEYLAHSFGTRKGTVATKLAVADSGYLSKQLSRATMTIKVEEHDCGTLNGLSFPVTDKDSIGCFLSSNVSHFNRNNEITQSMLNELESKNIFQIIVRSPITCQSSRRYHSGAVCQLCVGIRERGKLPDIGEYVGITASSALGEPMAQGQLNSKHQSSSASNKKSFVGFKSLNQLFNIPDNFKDEAPVAEFDGRVNSIKVAPQGGKYINITGGTNNKDFYIGKDLDPKVTVGQKVEAGDTLSDGIVDPSKIVKYKGIGEGRRYFSEAIKNSFDEAGLGGNRRNFELVAKNAIDHVKITSPEGMGDYLPDAVVSYQAIEKDYTPRPGNKVVVPNLAYNKYLEIPVLHYSIGTRVTNKVIADLNDHKIESITVHDDPPSFEPQMVRLLDVPEHEQDWMHQLYSTYLQKRFINAVNTGMTSNTKGASPVAGLAYGVGFGEKEEK